MSPQAGEEPVPLSRVLIQLAQAIDSARSIHEIYEAALSGVTAVTGVGRAAILLFDPDGVMRFKAWSGLSDAYRTAVEGHTPWAAGARAAEPIVVPDVLADASLAPLADAFRREHIRGLAFIPIVLSGGVIGKFMLYRESSRSFGSQEIADALAIGYQIGLAVDRVTRESDAVDAHQRLLFALDAAQMGTWDWDLSTGYVTWSENLERIHGLPPGSFTGGFESYEREIHPDDRGRVLASLQRAMTQQRLHDVEYRIVAPDGTVRWVHGKGRVKLDANGAPIGMTGVCMDISTRKEAEVHIRRALDEEAAVRARLAELTTGAQRLLTSVEGTAVVDAVLELAQRVIAAEGYAVWRLDGDSWRIAASRGVSAEFAATAMPRQVTVKFDSPVVAEDVGESELLAARREQYAREGVAALLSVPLIMRGESSGAVAFYYRTRHRPTEIELQVATALGQLAAAAISNAALYEEQQRLRRDAEDAEMRAAFLAEASAVLSSLDFERNLQRVAELAVPQLSDWCAVDLLNGDTIQRLAATHVDPAQVALARELHERYPASLDDTGVGLVIRTGTPQLYADITEEMLQASAHDAEHLRLIRALRVQSAMVVPLTSGRRTFGAITFVSSQDRRRFTAVDLEFAMELARRAALAIDNARLFGEAREANRLKDEFLATLSHELRTPLNVIVGRVKGLRERAQPHDVQRVVETIERNAQSLTRLVEDLLDVSRYVQGQLQLQVHSLDWQQTIQAVVASLEPSARLKGVRMTTRLNAGPATVLGDGTRLQQVAWNLVTNAIKFTGPGGEIAVSLTQDGNEFVMTVADTGVGISAAFLPHVFDLFRQEEVAVSRRQGGLGLGLSIVKRIVDLHGGRVAAQSDGPGRGAAFEVRLPCALAAAPPAPTGVSVDSSAVSRTSS